MFIQFNTKDLQEKLNGLAGVLSAQQMGRGVALGINRTLKQARTQSDREIRKVYNIRQEFVLRRLKVKNASISNMMGTISFPTRTVPLGEFIKTRLVKRQRGVKVEILRGKPETIKGAFLFKSKFPNKHLSVMHRSFVSSGSSYAGNFQFRHKRINKGGKDLPIGAMFSASTLSTVFNPIVSKNIRKTVEQKLMDNTFEILDKMVLGYIRDSNRRGRAR